MNNRINLVLSLRRVALKWANRQIIQDLCSTGKNSLLFADLSSFLFQGQIIQPQIFTIKGSTQLGLGCHALDWRRTVFLTEVPDPYLLSHGGQT